MSWIVPLLADLRDAGALRSDVTESDAKKRLVASGHKVSELQKAPARQRVAALCKALDEPKPRARHWHDDWQFDSDAMCAFLCEALSSTGIVAKTKVEHDWGDPEDIVRIAVTLDGRTHLVKAPMTSFVSAFFREVEAVLGRKVRFLSLVESDDEGHHRLFVLTGDASRRLVEALSEDDDEGE